MTPAYESLRFISQVIIKPQQAGERMILDFKEEMEDFGVLYDGPLGRAYAGVQQRTIDLRRNAMYEVHTDFPEEFKRLTAGLNGDKEKAYELYQALQQKTPEFWDKKPEPVLEEEDCCTSACFECTR